MNKTTNSLNKILRQTSPEQIPDFLNRNEESLITSSSPFAEYFRACLRERGLKQQTVFLNAELPERYGYKLLSEEKHTRQRDTILRLCFGAHLSLKEAQRALTIYGMSPLYPRFPRDAVLIVAFNRDIYEIAGVNDLLLKNLQPPLRGTQEE